jgi:hypothetical protein
MLQTVSTLLWAISKLADARLIDISEPNSIFRCKVMPALVEKAGALLHSLSRSSLSHVIVSLASLGYHPDNKWLADYVDVVLAAGFTPAGSRGWFAKKYLDVSVSAFPYPSLLEGERELHLCQPSRADVMQ